jgi:uncharacterized protein YbjT (DUF2867 family)
MDGCRVLPSLFPPLNERLHMKIVIIGGSGLIGKKLAALLQQAGHAVLAASPSSGVNAVTGEGLSQALAGAEVVVDVTNSPSFEDAAVMHFFQASTHNVLAAGLAARVRHHVALSVVGTEGLQGSGYFRAKLRQQELIEASGIPYTIVQATQFLEFLDAIAYSGTTGQDVRLPPALFQPIAADDVAALVAQAAQAEPRNGKLEIAGPQAVGLAALVQQYLAAMGDPRTVITDAQAPYFGVQVNDRSLTPGEGARLGAITYESWLDKR